MEAQVCCHLEHNLVEQLLHLLAQLFQPRSVRALGQPCPHALCSASARLRPWLYTTQRTLFLRLCDPLPDRLRDSVSPMQEVRLDHFLKARLRVLQHVCQKPASQRPTR